MLKSLINDDSAKIELPSVQKLITFCEAIGNKYPVLSTAWGAMDGPDSIK